MYGTIKKVSSELGNHRSFLSSGCLKEDKKRKDCMDEATEKSVKTFFQQDQVSTNLPSKKLFRKDNDERNFHNLECTDRTCAKCGTEKLTNNLKMEFPEVDVEWKKSAMQTTTSKKTGKEVKKKQVTTLKDIQPEVIQVVQEEQPSEDLELCSGFDNYHLVADQEKDQEVALDKIYATYRNHESDETQNVIKTVERAKSPNDPVLKITISGLPLSVDDSAILEMLDSLQVELKGLCGNPQHAYQLTKALRSGDFNATENIRIAPKALGAKRIGDKVKNPEKWQDQKQTIMEEIIHAKATQVPELSEKLENSDASTLISEATNNSRPRGAVTLSAPLDPQDPTRYVARNAVDREKSSCTRNYEIGRTSPHTSVLWRVDLGDIYSIYSIRILFKDYGSAYEKRQRGRFAGFSIYISNSTDRGDWFHCYKDKSGLPPLDFSTTCMKHGRYVIYYNERLKNITYPVGYQTTIITELCEVIVHGCAEKGVYGVNCDLPCPVNCQEKRCHIINGSCLGCMPGWNGDKCDKLCPVGWYGLECQHRCLGHCQHNASCHHESGSCVDGCAEGWMGPLCNKGASMGAVPSPEICDLRLFDILENITKKYNHRNKIVAHFRYKDDGFMVIDATESEILQFFELANLEHKYLKFTYNIHLNETVFLDTKVHKGQRFKQTGVLDVETFIKPTETFMYLHRSSAHPNATFRGFIKGEIIRHKRNTSDPHKTKQLISQFKKRLLSRGYSDSEIGSIVSETETINRQDLLKNSKTKSNRPPSVLVTKYNPAVQKLGKILRKHWKIIQKDKQLRRKTSERAKTKRNIPENNASFMELRQRKTPKQSITTERSKDRSKYKSSDVEEIVKRGPPTNKTIPTKNLHAIIAKMSAAENAGFKHEYHEIPRGELFPCEESKKPENKPKNRYTTTFPYDHSRVVLKTSSPNESDYINANYIKDTQSNRKYIATQGPKPKTVVDFWKMVWQECVNTIVCLTNLKEGTKIKCTQYWPNFSDKVQHGIFIIRNLEEKIYANYTSRRFKVYNNLDKKDREVLMLHYTRWPDHGVPNPLSLVVFHRHVMKTSSQTGKYMLVHCSAGIGRTGTYLALDALYRDGERNGRINVPMYVRTMRKDRMNMIQGDDQYRVVYLALCESFSGRSRCLTAESLSQQSQDRSCYTNCGEVSSTTSLSSDFQTLQSLRIKYAEKDCESGHTNKSANYTQSVLPVEKFLCYLSYTKGRNNYYNAVLLQSFTENDCLISAQYPLPDYTEDLLRLIRDFDARVVIFLGPLKEIKSSTLWVPSKSENKICGSFVLNLATSTNSVNFTTRNIVLHPKGGSDMRITVLECKTWKEGRSLADKRVLLDVVKEARSEKDKDEGKILILSSDGATRCGAFAVVYNALEQLSMDKEVDIFTITRQLQIRRPEFVSTLEEYQLCYEVVAEYMQNDSVYANC
ncbi:uncharacterized protein LOC133180172 [Saccostrea echinata]|uniref:uncharacterized protein LOC133180172 n=1 Tax=Saccostrea echinata TaxID=191078 RepID=UPI002A80B611|nr:uncharacterized protein LOC133180172 [Saccostrea echinata]